MFTLLCPPTYVLRPRSIYRLTSSHLLVVAPACLFQFRNSYDSDSTTFSPQGRCVARFALLAAARASRADLLARLLLQASPGAARFDLGTTFLIRSSSQLISLLPCAQVEYALEAVKQGSAAVGLRSNTHAVLLALKVRAPPGSRSTDELALDHGD